MDVCKFKLPCIILLLACSNAFGQGKDSFDLKSQIKITSNSVRLDSLLKNISRQTGFIFSYNTRKINHSLRFTFSNKNYSVEELLTKIKEKTGLDYSIADNHIILKSSRLMASPLKIQTVPTSLKEIKKENAILKGISSKPLSAHDSSKVVLKANDQPVSISSVAKEPVEKITEAIKDDQKNTIEYPEQKIQPVQNKPVLIKNQDSKKDSLIKVTKKESKPSNQKRNIKELPFWVKAGISLDETIYLGPTLQFGIPSIYGTFSYKTDFKLALLSYGLGTSFKLGKTLKLNLQVNTGYTSKFYDSAVLSGYDSASVQRGINAKSNLTRIGFLIEKNLTSRIILQGGLQYNLLTTKYSGVPVTENGNQLCAISPPYLLTNSTNARGDSNVKSWIGLQVNLLYTFNFYKKK